MFTDYEQKSQNLDKQIKQDREAILLMKSVIAKLAPRLDVIFLLLCGGKYEMKDLIFREYKYFSDSWM